jgi:hypothetical protein
MVWTTNAPIFFPFCCFLTAISSNFRCFLWTFGQSVQQISINKEWWKFVWSGKLFLFVVVVNVVLFFNLFKFKWLMEQSVCWMVIVIFWGLAVLCWEFECFPIVSIVWCTIRFTISKRTILYRLQSSMTFESSDCWDEDADCWDFITPIDSVISLSPTIFFDSNVLNNGRCCQILNAKWSAVTLFLSWHGLSHRIVKFWHRSEDNNSRRTKTSIDRE